MRLVLLEVAVEEVPLENLWLAGHYAVVAAVLVLEYTDSCCSPIQVLPVVQPAYRGIGWQRWEAQSHLGGLPLVRKNPPRQVL